MDDNNNVKKRRSYTRHHSAQFNALLRRDRPVTRSSTGGITKKDYSDTLDSIEVAYNSRCLMYLYFLLLFLEHMQQKKYCMCDSI